MILDNKFRIDFIVVGVQKSGTTALDSYLRQHPEIEMADVKELHFFDNDSFFKNNEVDYNPYHKHFGLEKVNRIFGEITPSYIFLEKSINRIKEYNSAIKLIAILRSPIDRAFSNWNMEVQRKNENRLFLNCINEEIENLSNIKTNYSIYNSFVKRGFYKKQIENIQNNFSEDQVLYIKYEDFLSNQNEELVKIFDFLNLELKNIKFEKKIKHKVEYKNSIGLNEIEILYNLYKNDIKFVEEKLGWNCDDWKKKC